MNDRTEEENVEMLREWWASYGSTLIASIVLVLGGIVGWHFWDEYRIARANEGALAYQGYLDALEAYEADPDDGTRAALLEAGAELEEDFAGTAYAVFAALGRARVAVREDDLDTARAALERARDDATSDYMRDLALVRLARVQYAQGNAQGALRSLDAVSTPGMETLTQELRGDVHASVGDVDAAAEAYRAALAEAELPEIRLMLELKLNGLGEALPDSDARLVRAPGADGAGDGAEGTPPGTTNGEADGPAEDAPGAGDSAAGPAPDGEAPPGGAGAGGNGA